MRSKAWLAAREALMRRERLVQAGQGMRASWRATLAAGPVLFAHAFDPCHIGKTLVPAVSQH